MKRRIQALTLCLAGLAGTASAQTASYKFFGNGCATIAVPLEVQGVPALGATFTVETSGPLFSQFVIRQTVLFTGVSDSRFGPLGLPFDLGQLSVGTVQFCGSLLTSIELMIPVPFGSGATTSEVPFTVPNNPALLGAQFFQQALETDMVRLTGITFLSTSRGGRGTIGR